MNTKQTVSTQAAAIAFALQSKWRHFGESNLAQIVQDVLDQINQTDTRTDAAEVVNKPMSGVLDLVKGQYLMPPPALPGTESSQRVDSDSKPVNQPGSGFAAALRDQWRK